MSSDIMIVIDQALDIPKTLEDGPLQLALMDEALRYSLRLKRADLTVIKKASGLKLPTKIGQSHIAAGQHILCLGPDEWFIIAELKDGETLSKALAKIEQDFTVSLTEVSHRNIGFELSGVRAVKALNAGCPLDLSLEAFPIGKTTRTVFESAALIVTRLGEDKFRLETWRSFAPYLRDFFARIEHNKSA